LRRNIAMIIITKDGRKLLPLLFGSYENPAYSQFITCVDCADVAIIDNELDVKNKKILVHTSQIQAFQGTYSFSTFYAKKKQDKADDTHTASITCSNTGADKKKEY
jgi:hypothetical protein